MFSFTIKCLSFSWVIKVIKLYKYLVFIIYICYHNYAVKTQFYNFILGNKMKKTVSKYEFMNDSRLTNNFSYHGLEALFEHLEDWEESCGQELEYDPVAIRCDFTEFASIQEIANYYTEIPLPPEKLDEDDDTDYEEESLEWLRDRTSVIVFEGGIILQDF